MQTGGDGKECARQVQVSNNGNQAFYTREDQTCSGSQLGSWIPSSSKHVDTSILCGILFPSHLSFCLLTRDVSLQRSLAGPWRRSTTTAANMLTWRSEARLNATTWEQDAPIYFLLGRCHHECCSCSTDLPPVGVRPAT